jgi:hypothetical protein
MRKVLQLRKLCHCIIRWEKLKNSRPVRQCFNCQSLDNFCGKPSKCVKCNLPHASKDCTKPADASPKCVNCGGDHPANFTGCPQYQQQLHLTQRTTYQHRMLNPKSSTPPFRYQQLHFPALKTPQRPSRPPQTWAHIAAQSQNVPNQQPLSSALDSTKSILAMFDLHQFCTQLRSSALQLQEMSKPITKLVVIDTVVSCLATSQ